MFDFSIISGPSPLFFLCYLSYDMQEYAFCLTVVAYIRKTSSVLMLAVIRWLTSLGLDFINQSFSTKFCLSLLSQKNVSWFCSNHSSIVAASFRMLPMNESGKSAVPNSYYLRLCLKVGIFKTLWKVFNIKGHFPLWLMFERVVVDQNVKALTGLNIKSIPLFLSDLGLQKKYTRSSKLVTG